MNLGIYIGSFNPPHLGHIDVISYLLTNNYVDSVLLVPTGAYWHKQDLVGIKHRINMLKLYENNNIIIDSEHNNLKYTYLLMRELIKIYRKYKLYIILGADNIIDFDKWQHYEELLNYKIIIMNRDNIDINKYIEKYKTNNFIVINDYQFLPISSSEIRNNLDSKYLSPKVLKYIKEHHLYEKE